MLIGIRAWCFTGERAVRRSVGLARHLVIKQPTAVCTAEAAAAAILHTVKIGSQKKMYGTAMGCQKRHVIVPNASLRKP
jgi:hypothetical protein